MLFVWIKWLSVTKWLNRSLTIITNYVIVIVIVLCDVRAEAEQTVCISVKVSSAT